MRRSFAAIAFALMAFAPPAHGAFTYRIDQVGDDVVVTGTGTLNLAGVAAGGAINPQALVGAIRSTLVTGAPAGARSYAAYFSGPAGFGPGGPFTATSGTGDRVGFFGSFSGLVIPEEYTSGASLNSTSTFAGRTIASLGLTPGTYVYNYSGSVGGPIVDTITVQIGTGTVPEPASIAMVGLGLAGVGLPARRRIRA